MFFISIISCLYSAAQSFADDNSPVRIHPYPGGALELSAALSFATKLEHESAILIENLYSVVVTICNNDVPFIVHSNAKYPVKFSNFRSLFAKLEVGFSSIDNIDFKRTTLDVLVSDSHRHL